MQPIFEAARQSDVDRVRALLKSAPCLATSHDESGDQPLHVAGNPDIVDLLIESGADVNAKGADDMSPLQSAAKYGSVDVVARLIAHGADVNYVNPMGSSPLIYAITLCSAEGARIVELLLEAGANYDVYAAAARGDLKRVRQVLEGKPNTLSEMSLMDKESMLALAARNKPQEWGGVGNVDDRSEIIKILFARGLDLEKETIRNVADHYSDSKKLADLLRQYAQ